MSKALGCGGETDRLFREFTRPGRIWLYFWYAHERVCMTGRRAATSTSHAHTSSCYLLRDTPWLLSWTWKATPVAGFLHYRNDYTESPSPSSSRSSYLCATRSLVYRTCRHQKISSDSLCLAFYFIFLDSVQTAMPSTFSPSDGCLPKKVPTCYSIFIHVRIPPQRCLLFSMPLSRKFVASRT